MKDVKVESVGFLIKNGFALGKVSIAQGDPGVGKSLVVTEFVAQITRGGEIPGWGSVIGGPQSCLILMNEDDVADTIRPRLEKAGANLGLVHILRGIKEGDVKRAIEFKDTSALGLALEKVQPSLIVFDPLQSFLGSRVDFYRANETRPLLDAIRKLAEKHNVAVLIVRHLAKQRARNAISAGLGSVDFSAFARTIFGVYQHPEAPQKRLVIHEKSNIGPLLPTLVFNTAEGRVNWEGTSNISDMHAFGVGPEAVSRTEEAAEQIQMLLSTGPVPASLMEAALQEQGFSKGTMIKAKRLVGVKSVRVGEQNGIRGKGMWEWVLADS